VTVWHKLFSLWILKNRPLWLFGSGIQGNGRPVMKKMGVLF
jgi:hypothetical protein